MDKDDEKKLPEEKKNNLINAEDNIGSFWFTTDSIWFRKDSGTI